MPKEIQVEATQPQTSQPAACKNKMDALTASIDAPSPKKRRRLDNEEKITTPWCTKERLSSLSLAQAYELIGGDVDVDVKNLFGHIPSGENRGRHVYAYLIKQIEQKIINGEISEDAFVSVTGLKKAMEIGEAKTSKKTEEIMTEEAKISKEINSLPKAASISASTLPEKVVPSNRNSSGDTGDSLSTNNERGKKSPKKKTEGVVDAYAATDKNLDAANGTNKPRGTGIYAVTPDLEWLRNRFAFDLFRSRNNGRNPSTKSLDPNEVRLAKWVKQQVTDRNKSKKGTSDELTQAKLESLKQIVEFPFFAPKVQEKLHQLKLYTAAHGHCNVPDGDGPLGKWISQCRKRCKEGTIDPDLKIMLQDMGLAIDNRKYVWNTMFEQLKAFKEKHGHLTVSRRGNAGVRDGPLNSWIVTQKLNYKNNKLSQEYIAKLEGIGFSFEGSTYRSAEDHISKLKEYQEQHGHFNVLVGDDPKLSKWVSSIQRQHKAGTIHPSLKAQLDEIEFTWEKTIDQRVQSHLEDLRAFREEHGHCDVFGYGNIKLSRFLSTVKAKHTNGTLEHNLELELEKLGVEWLQWDVMYEELKAYYEQFGHYNVEQSAYAPEYRKLASWVYNQRFCYQQEPKEISENRIAKLESIGFDWKLTKSTNQGMERDSLRNYSTEELLVQLRNFKEQHGHLLIGKGNGPLGQWVQYLRSKNNSGSLNPQLKAQCEEIGLQWSHWDEMFCQLKKYKESYGHSKVPRVKNDCYEHAGLSRWVQGVRDTYRKGKLSQERIAKLNEIGFEFFEDKKLTPWEERFRELTEYKNEHGHCNVPKKWNGNVPLANWVCRQRLQYSAGAIKQERYDALNTIGFVWSFKSPDDTHYHYLG